MLNLPQRLREKSVRGRERESENREVAVMVLRKRRPDHFLLQSYLESAPSSPWFSKFSHLFPLHTCPLCPPQGVSGSFSLPTNATLPISDTCGFPPFCCQQVIRGVLTITPCPDCHLVLKVEFREPFSDGCH